MATVMEPPFRTFAYHYRQKYGHPVGKIPLDMGIPCPNRRRGGCIFCRGDGFSPGYLHKTTSISQQILQGKRHLLRNRFSKYFAYFQQETSTALHPDLLLPVFRSVLEDDDCLGIILSTRPDSVEQNLLEQLSAAVTALNKECLIELGLQTVHSAGLQVLNRNHSFVDCCDAIRRIQDADNLGVGVHFIFGIPGESEEDMLTSVATVAAMGVQAVKFHHLQVLRDTVLHRMYEEGRVRTFTLEQYCRFLLKALPLLPEHIVIHRLWATAHPDMLIAPRWNILATHLSRILRQTMEKFAIRQGHTGTGPGWKDDAFRDYFSVELQKRVKEQK
jgi:hypothetical protein